MSRIHVRCIAAIAFIALSAAAAGAAEFKDLINRIPGEANVLVAINVDKILASPMATKNGWKQKMSDAFSNGPLLAPPDTKKIVMAGLIDAQLQSDWEISVMEVGSVPAASALARAEQGFVDKLGDKDAVWTPDGAYFVKLEDQLLGVVAPANRQFAARWAAKKQTLQGAFASNYLRTAAGAVDSGTEFLLAVDLEDMPCELRLMQRLSDQPLECLAGKKIDPKTVAQILASLKGLTLRVEIADQATATATIDFGKDLGPLAEVAKPLVLEALARMGASLKDAEGWNVSARGQQIRATGAVSADGLRHLFSIVEPPAPIMPSNSAQTAGNTQDRGKGTPPPPAGSTDNRAAASQKYFRSVCDTLDKLNEEIGKGSRSAALSQCATWFQRDARRIGRLPILDVDPDLVAWGNDIVARMQEAANVFSKGQFTTLQRSASVPTPVATDWDVDWNSAAFRDAANQRQSAVMDEKSKAAEAAGKIFGDMMGSRVKMRTELTKRYGVEF